MNQLEQYTVIKVIWMALGLLLSEIRVILTHVLWYCNSQPGNGD